MNDLKKDIEKAKIKGYVTCCPICGNYVESYFCENCNVRIVPEKVTKVDYVIEMAVKNLI